MYSAAFFLTANASVSQATPALEEIIVTAQKQEESLQDTPIALDAFGADRLEQEGISNVADLANNVPAMTIEPFPTSAATLRIYIRGIGLIDAQVTQDPPIGISSPAKHPSTYPFGRAPLQNLPTLKAKLTVLSNALGLAKAITLATRIPMAFA